ncbi:hypothetical protein BKA81DRAFT_162840 [Phyllosticta paracitricarpa]
MYPPTQFPTHESRQRKDTPHRTPPPPPPLNPAVHNTKKSHPHIAPTWKPHVTNKSQSSSIQLINRQHIPISKRTDQIIKTRKTPSFAKKRHGYTPYEKPAAAAASAAADLMMPNDRDDDKDKKDDEEDDDARLLAPDPESKSIAVPNLRKPMTPQSRKREKNQTRSLEG